MSDNAGSDGAASSPNPPDHAAERNRRALKTTLTALAGRGLGMMLSLISVPLTVGYLDPERYGLWLTIGSLLAWLSIADLGLGSGVSNAITTARARGDHESARRAISNAFIILGAVALSIGVVFAASFSFIPWARVLAASPRVDPRELSTTIALCLAFFALGFPLGLVDRVLQACQEGYVANYWGTAAGALTTVALVLAVRFASGLPTLVLALSGVPLAVRLACTYWVFARKHPELRPTFRDYRRETARSLLNTGAAFLLAQLAALAILQTDNIVISHLYGPAAVGPYAIAMRIATVLSGLALMWLAPLWPAYADAAARGDIAWIRAALRRSTRLLMAGAAAASIGIILLGQWAILVWVRKPEYVPSRRLLAPIAVYLLLLLWCQVYAIALNGLGRVRGQVVYGSASGLVNLVLSVVLGVALGVDGVCWATDIAMLIPAVFAPWELHRALREGKLVAEPAAA